ncbi:hypothetical protein [Ferrimonas futtsuensis]|uniref:hypothetical protein n=1 Tax=Ferrimonas futtsuensis TaxID=364764 RepID=UPI0003F9781F|nr:hypothetical protein [Ferrimonas futtsuensis]
MRIAILMLMLATALPAWARHAYPKFYFQVDHIRSFEYAISGNHWYPPTRDNRRVLQGVMALNTPDDQRQLVRDLSRDPNLERGLRQLGGELTCLVYRYLAKEGERPLCFDAASSDSRRKQTTPFFDRNSPYHKEPLQLTYPERAASYLTYRFRMTVPSGNRYDLDNPFYPLHRLGYGMGGNNSDALIVTVFLEVLTESESGLWQPVTLSHSQIPLYLHLPSQRAIGKSGSLRAAFDLGSKEVRLLDYTGQRW